MGDLGIAMFLTVLMVLTLNAGDKDKDLLDALVDSLYSQAELNREKIREVRLNEETSTAYP